MAKYRIVKTIMAKHPNEFLRSYYFDLASKPIFVVEKKTWFGWNYIDWEYTQYEADDCILRLKGEHPDQIALRKLLEHEDEVVKEYD